MLKLYKTGNSVCTQKVLITLAEKGADYDTQNVSLFHNEQFDPAYLKINPKGVVPSLVDDGRAVIESTLICEYLDERFPAPPLMPAEPHQRARMRLWSKAIDEGIFEAAREISFSAVFRERMKTMTEAQRQTRFRNVGDPERRDRFMSTFAEGVESPFVLYAIASFEKLFRSMEESLEADGPWMLGGEFTLADVNLIPFVARLEFLNLLDLWTAKRPRVRQWWQLAQARASVRGAIHDQITPSELAEMHAAGTKIRERIRERRDDYLAAFHSLAG